MLTKYKFLLSNNKNTFSRFGKNLGFNNIRYSKFTTQAETKTTVRLFGFNYIDNCERCYWFRNGR